MPARGEGRQEHTKVPTTPHLLLRVPQRKQYNQLDSLHCIRVRETERAKLNNNGRDIRRRKKAKIGGEGEKNLAEAGGHLLKGVVGRVGKPGKSVVDLYVDHEPVLIQERGWDRLVKELGIEIPQIHRPVLAAAV